MNQNGLANASAPAAQKVSPQEKSRRIMKATQVRLLKGLSVAFFVLLPALPGPAHGQYPVGDDLMAERNRETLMRHAFEQLMEHYAILDFTREMMRGLPDSEFEWRDAGELAIAVERVMSEPSVLGYTREDLHILFEEVYPGFAPVADWGVQQEGRLRQVLATHRAVLLSLAHDQQRWAAQQERLLRLRRRIEGVGRDWESFVTPFLPDVAPRQKLMELRANAKALAQQEAVLLREALLGRSLLFTLQNAAGPDAKARRLALTERAVGIASP